VGTLGTASPRASPPSSKEIRSAGSTRRACLRTRLWSCAVVYATHV